jgi:carboxylesterase type B
MVGDRFFYVPFDHSLKIHSKFVSAPMYAYYFTFKGKHGVPEKFNLRPVDWGRSRSRDRNYIIIIDWETQNLTHNISMYYISTLNFVFYPSGVMHTDELQYLFNNTEFFAPLARSDSDYIIARYFTELWSNFAATG